MQPETKVKENGQIKEPTPAEQWDQLAFQVIYRELAPKGFKKVTGGSYKGQIIAACDGPGLPKIKVTSVQKIAAQLVRGFREKAKKEIEKELAAAKVSFDEARKSWRDCPWWRLREKYKKRDKGQYWCALVDSLETLIEKLDNISIK